jgi:hypothetical protein
MIMHIWRIHSSGIFALHFHNYENCCQDTRLFPVDVPKQQTSQMLEEQRCASAHSVSDHIQDLSLSKRISFIPLKVAMQFSFVHLCKHLIIQ